MSPVIRHAALPTIQAIQQSQPSVLGPSQVNQVDVKESLDRAHRALANELVRLTETLGQHDPRAKEYDECLTLVHRVVETMHTMRK